jgi:hypothetical protein
MVKHKVTLSVIIDAPDADVSATLRNFTNVTLGALRPLRDLFVGDPLLSIEDVVLWTPLEKRCPLCLRRWDKHPGVLKRVPEFTKTGKKAAK